MKLNDNQEMILRNIKTANDSWRRVKLDARERARIAAEKEVADYLAAMDHEVRLGVDAGVPKLQIGRDGLRTTSPMAVRESLARTAGVAAILANFPMASFEQAVSA